MPALTIRNVPDDLYATLKRLAAQNRRSLQQEVLVRLEAVRVDDTASPLARAEAIRARLAGRSLGDTVADIRAERER
jgi:plasmid stability protein